MRKVKQWVAAWLLIALSLTNCLAVSAESRPVGTAEAAVPPKAEQEASAQAENTEKAEKTTTQSATIQASVPAAGAAYTVVIPEGLHMGTLDASQDFRQDYTVSVEVYPSEKPIFVTVSAQDSFPMIQTAKQISAGQMTCYNRFETTTFTENGQKTGQLTIPKKEIAAAAPGRYTGTLEFTICSQRQDGGEVPGPDEPTKPTETPQRPESTAAPETTPQQPETTQPVVTPQPTIVPQPTTTTKPLEPGTITEDGHYTASVSMRKDSDFNQISMCNKLFYPKVDIERKGDMATVTMYVIDPVPQFANEGTPLRNMSLTYDGKNYPVQVNSGSKVMKNFNAAAGFINKAGEYSASPLVVTLPVKALTDSVNQAVTSRAFVNAVMKQDVNFYIVFSDLTPTGGKATNKPASKKTTFSSNSNSGNTADTQTLTLDEGEKSWYTSAVSMRRADDFDKESMCDPLFFAKADIMYQGDIAELTLYVIDPVPKFADEGTPIKDVTFLYDGKSYTSTLLSDKKQEKHFDAASGFISEAGEYPATPIKVVLPKQAIEESIDGKLKCSAYINTVMKTTQEFYVVLSELEEGQPPADQLEDSADKNKNDAGNTENQAQQAAAPISEIVRLHTKLFPQVLGYVLFTAVILGGAFAALWFRRR